MHSKAAIDVLGLQELEEADGNGVVIPLEERRQATEVAGLVAAASAPEGKRRAERDEAMERRAFRLLKDVRAAVCVKEITEGAARPVRGIWLVAVTVLLALALGFLTNQMGGGKVINLLSLPMLGLVMWNLFVYAVWGAGKLGVFGDSFLGDGHVFHFAWLNRWLLRSAGLKADHAHAEKPMAPEGTAAVVAVARRRFWEKWTRVLRAQAAEWVELAFHAGAIALAAGLAAGMYARGLSSEYKAAWESTFLDAPAVSAVLRTALGPASLALGETIPQAEGMQLLNIHDQEKMEPHERESAARWIHMYALTAVLFIGLPRLGLASLAWRQLRRIDARTPLEPAVQVAFEGLVRQVTGRESPVWVLPFAAEPPDDRQHDLRAALRRLWPETGTALFLATVPYGGEDEALEKLAWPPQAEKRTAATPPTRLAVLMSLSSTPENEVHGQLLRELNQRAASGSREDGESLAVVLDTRPFRTQFEFMPEHDRRLRERRAAWERLISSCLEAAFSEEGDFCVWRRVGRRR